MRRSSDRLPGQPSRADGRRTEAAAELEAILGCRRVGRLSVALAAEVKGHVLRASARSRCQRTFSHQLGLPDLQGLHSSQKRNEHTTRSPRLTCVTGGQHRRQKSRRTVFADRLDHPSALVAENDALGCGKVTCGRMDVGSTDPCRDDADEGLVVGWLLELDRLAPRMALSKLAASPRLGLHSVRVRRPAAGIGARASAAGAAMWAGRGSEVIRLQRRSTQSRCTRSADGQSGGFAGPARFASTICRAATSRASRPRVQALCTVVRSSKRELKLRVDAKRS